MENNASVKYTREQLESMGMEERQIQAILATYEAEGTAVQAPVQKSEVVPFHSNNVGAVNPINCDEAMQITSVTDLQKYASGTVVRFPDFAEGQPFVARVRRPSMLVLAKQGKIPNTLLTAAGELFSKGGAGLDSDNENMLSDMYNIMDIIATSALIQPSMQEIKGAGLELSDDQMMAIFNYTQAGVKALESFRKE